MKKLLAIVLALVMVLSMTACSSKETAKATEAPAAEAKPAATEAPAEAEAPTSEGKRCAFLFATLEGAYWQTVVDDYTAEINKYGISVDAMNADGDVVRQVEQIENAVVQGYDMLFVFAVDPNGVADACKKAMDSGVLVYSFIKDVGEENCNCFRGANEGIIGEGLVQAAADWAIENVSSEDKGINVIIMGGSSAGSETERYEAACAYAATIPQFNILETVRVETSQSAAQSATENLLVNHEDVNLIIYCSAEMALGGNAYIESEACPIKDISKLGIFGGGMSAEAADAMKRAAEGSGACRGFINTGGTNAQSGAEIATQMNLMFTTTDYPSATYVPAVLVNLDNMADFGY